MIRASGFRAMVVVLAVAGLGSSALAQQKASIHYGELLKRVPDGANAMMLVDVDGLLNSKLGLRERWRDDYLKAQSRGMLFPGNVSKMLVTSQYDLRESTETWQITLAQMAQGASLGGIQKRENGFSDQIGDVPVVWSRGICTSSRRATRSSAWRPPPIARGWPDGSGAPC